ncbi:chalcone isomerase family protein [Alteromonas sp. D210916BOD_24]|uniref:chalcone isomerase family protein n=1 Tax=Alteromonas sp. D210916BOD_24 TaxID=3157618 RepID=UPI00399D21E6
MATKLTSFMSNSTHLVLLWANRLLSVLLIQILCFFPSSHAFAQVSSEISDHVPEAELVGQGMFTYYLWDVYLGQLYAPAATYTGQAPFALKLTYQRDLKGKKIAQRSIEEMQKQQPLSRETATHWLALMETLFPDVQKGDSITGVATRDGTTVFYFNGDEIDRVEDAGFTTRFFDIWLGSKTTEPVFKAKLLGENSR